MTGPSGYASSSVSLMEAGLERGEQSVQWLLHEANAQQHARPERGGGGDGDAQQTGAKKAIPLTRHVRITKHSSDPVLLKHARRPPSLSFIHYTTASISLCHFDNKPTGDIARKRGKVG